MDEKTFEPLNEKEFMEAKELCQTQKHEDLINRMWFEILVLRNNAKEEFIKEPKDYEQGWYFG